jgi:hypothetical protein
LLKIKNPDTQSRTFFNIMFDTLKVILNRNWRVIILLGFAIGLLLPWRETCSDVLELDLKVKCGFTGIWWKIEDSYNTLRHIENFAPQYINFRLLDIIMLIGVISLMLYFIGSVYQIILNPIKVQKNLPIFLYVTCIFSALILIPDFISPNRNSGVAIGYHLTTIIIFGSFLLEGNNNMNLNTKYPYLTAWIGIIALNALAGTILLIVPSVPIRLLLQVVVGFFIFRFVVEHNILPYIQKNKIKDEISGGN